MASIRAPESHLPLELRTHVLDNGLRLVMNRSQELPLVALSVWYHVGSKHERPGRTGFAHLFEHLLFQGSQHVGTNDHIGYVQQVGGIANGSTWYDRTNYYEVLPSHCLSLGLWLESDRMGFFLPAITSEKLENQREVVLNERRQRVDNQPYGRAFERLNELLFPEGHPYRWPVIGYVDDIRAATLEDVTTFFGTHYVPRNSLLTLVGDLEFEEAQAQVERFFGPLEAGNPPPQPEIAPVVLQQEQRAVLPDRVRLPRIYMGFHGGPVGSRDWYLAQLLASIWTEGKTSVLYEDLVYGRQLAQDVFCFVYSTEVTASIVLISTARPGVDPHRLEEALDAHLRQAAKELYEPYHLERARNQRLMTLFLEMQMLDKRADLLARCTLFQGDPNLACEEPRRYQELTAEDLRDFAERRLGLHQRAILTVLPEDAA